MNIPSNDACDFGWEALAAVKDDPACRARREGPNRPKYIRELRKAMDYVKAMDDGVIRLSNDGGALKDKKIQREFDEILKRNEHQEKE